MLTSSIELWRDHLSQYTPAEGRYRRRRRCVVHQSLFRSWDCGVGSPFLCVIDSVPCLWAFYGDHISNCMLLSVSWLGYQLLRGRTRFLAHRPFLRIGRTKFPRPDILSCQHMPLLRGNIDIPLSDSSNSRVSRMDNAGFDSAAVAPIRRPSRGAASVFRQIHSAFQNDSCNQGQCVGDACVSVHQSALSRSPWRSNL
jgi:hypothetical protein